MLAPAEEAPTRQALIDAMKQRRTYAATDNIVGDLRIGNRLRGEAFETSGRPPLKARVIGTGPIARVVLFKNSELVYTATPNGRQVEFECRDDSVGLGASYYSVRVEQEDGSLAWASPIWVTYR